jgi:hypothetical protein
LLNSIPRRAIWTLVPDNPAGHMGWPSQRIAPVDQSFDRTRGVDLTLAALHALFTRARTARHVAQSPITDDGLLAVAVAMGVAHALIRTRSFGCLPTLRG